MKPLLSKDLAAFIQRFDSFKDGEFRSIEVVSPTSMKVTLAGQDSAKEFDWISLELEFSGVSDARLLESTKLPLIDMSDGLSIIYENGNFAFGVGECQTASSIKSSTSYIICTSLKYQEGAF